MIEFSLKTITLKKKNQLIPTLLKMKCFILFMEYEVLVWDVPLK